MLVARKGENQNHANVHPTFLKGHMTRNSIFILLVNAKASDKLGKKAVLVGISIMVGLGLFCFVLAVSSFCFVLFA